MKEEKRWKTKATYSHLLRLGCWNNGKKETGRGKTKALREIPVETSPENQDAHKRRNGVKTMSAQK